MLFLAPKGTQIPRLLVTICAKLPRMRFQVFVNKRPLGTLDLGVQGIGSHSLVIYPASELQELLSANGHAADDVHFDLVSEANWLEGCYVAGTLMVGSAQALRLAFAHRQSIIGDAL